MATIISQKMFPPLKCPILKKLVIPFTKKLKISKYCCIKMKISNIAIAPIVLSKFQKAKFNTY
jgi:hypothetical protein